MATAAADKLPEAAEAIMDLHAIRRIVTLEEVAATVCFLAGSDTGYISGNVVDVAGEFQI
ncbi:SDR family oxidoreductase [Phormidium sp. CLA17]|nr:SDR family oxidoreductase [Leptolyngbya sp. Cla-17]